MISHPFARRTRLVAPAAWMLLVTVSALAGCAAADEAKTDGEDSAEIVAGTEASSRPEACVIAFDGYICSGALIAPNVVLTAGHCVAGHSAWRVTCPYSSDPATVSASQGQVAPNYPNRDDPSRTWIDDSRGSDIGLIRLDRALRETRVGRTRLSGVTTGTRVAAIGRINNGVATNRMFRSPAFQITSIDRANGYWVAVDRTVIQPGDSGGPLVDDATNEIVGVNSAGVDASACTRGSVCDQWAVLGAAATWLNATVASYTGGSTPTPTPTPTPAPAPSPSGCAAATSCGACTALATCGWCNGACVEGTSAGGAACTSAAGNWAWTTAQCTAPVDPCASSTSCGTCTARASCGWCNGRCYTGTGAGPNGATCGASTPWAWYSSQCR